MISIELTDGEDLILIRGMDSAMATDGYYVPAERYAEEEDVPLRTVESWKRRKSIEAITIFGRSYVKKGCKPELRIYRKRAKIACDPGDILCKSANPEGH